MTTKPTNEYSAYVKLGSDIIEASKEMCGKTGLSPKSIENIKLCSHIILQLQQTAFLVANMRNEQPLSAPPPSGYVSLGHVKFK